MGGGDGPGPQLDQDPACAARYVTAPGLDPVLSASGRHGQALLFLDSRPGGMPLQRCQVRTGPPSTSMVWPVT